ncbi:MAG TPA: hypothetical protein VN982_01705 [Candidatus Dormibacteraeota bacterium]|nr:hypothetical protein [Candidatus Dormibacteraeota bacterium]
MKKSPNKGQLDQPKGQSQEQRPPRRSTIDFDAELYNRIKAIADRDERDFGSQVRFICKQWLEQQPKEAA